MLCCALTQAAEFLDEKNGFPHLLKCFGRWWSSRIFLGMTTTLLPEIVSNTIIIHIVSILVDLYLPPTKQIDSGVIILANLGDLRLIPRVHFLQVIQRTF